MTAPRSDGSLRSVAAMLTLVSACGLSACSPERESELLELRSVSPDRVEPGHVLRVRGAGFPPGRDARVRIEGTMHAPGESPRDIEIELAAHARSSDEVEGRFTDAALSALGGRGTVRGRVSVLFAAGRGAVVGHLPDVVLDVTPPSTERLGEELSRRRRGAALAAALGVTLAEEAPDESGLAIERVEAGSIAARAGVVPGDRLVALEGVRLHALSDLVPPPGRREARIEALREGEAAPFVVVVPLGERSGRLSKDELTAARVALGWVLFILLFLAPSARLVDGWTRRSRPGARIGRRAVLGVAIAAALFAALVGLDRAALLHAPLPAIVLVALVARASAAYLTARSTGTWSALAAVLRALGAVVVVALSLACVAALGGTSDLATLHAMQGPAPWEWTALRTPAGPLVVGLILAAGAWSPRERGDRLAADAVALLLAAVIAAALLGGWTAGEQPSTWARALAGLGFVVKALLCWAAMRRPVRPSARGAAAMALALAAAVALTAAWIAWEPGLEVERALAEVLSAALGAVVLWLGARRVAGLARREPLAPPHAFL